MSISSEITRLSGNVSDALTAIAAKGVTVPSGSNSDDLATLIGQISTGGTAAISIVDTPDSHGGDVRTITALDISDTTAVAADVAQGKYFYTSNGTKTAGSATIGGNDFVVTLSWDDDYFGQDEGAWIPDKTFAQIQAAYTAGKEIVVVTDALDDAFAEGYWDEEDVGGFVYHVSFFDYNKSPSPFCSSDYSYDSNGIDGQIIEYHYVGDATISSNSQLLNGVIAYGADGTDYTGNILTKTSSDLTANGATVTVPSGYYASQATKQVASGTAGTPTATKGTVSNHSVSVTPSVTNTTGYIEGSTKTGTAVTVSASELVSGNLPITQNGNNIDVSNYSTVSVNVSGGGSSGMTVATATATPASASSSISFTGLSGEPTSFAVISTSDLATGASPYKTAAVVFDGTNVIGQRITNTSNANANYDGTGFSKTYSNGTLTITGTGTNFQANQYSLVYTYGGNSANIATEDVQVGSGATSITFTGLSDEPSYFSCIFKSDFGTSSGYQRVIAVVYDGTSTYGMELDSSAHYSTAHWSHTYSNGSLTISSQGTNAGGYFHQPGDYQLTYGIGGEISIDIEPLSVTQNGTYSESGKAYSPVVVNVPSSGGANFATATMTNSSNQATSIEFTLPSGRTPKAFFARLTSQIARNSSSRYYYVFDMRWDGSSTGGVAGNTFYMYNGTLSNVTSGYSHSQDGTAFTLTTTGSRSASPGSFYNGTYELVYVY